MRQRLRIEAVEHITSELELSLRILFYLKFGHFGKSYFIQCIDCCYEHVLSRFLYPDNKEISGSNVLAETQLVAQLDYHLYFNIPREVVQQCASGNLASCPNRLSSIFQHPKKNRTAMFQRKPTQLVAQLDYHLYFNIPREIQQSNVLVETPPDPELTGCVTQPPVSLAK